MRGQGGGWSEESELWRSCKEVCRVWVVMKRNREKLKEKKMKVKKERWRRTTIICVRERERSVWGVGDGVLGKSLTNNLKRKRNTKKNKWRSNSRSSALEKIMKVHVRVEREGQGNMEHEDYEMKWNEEKEEKKKKAPNLLFVLFQNQAKRAFQSVRFQCKTRQ